MTKETYVKAKGVKELGNRVEDICDILEGASKGGEIATSTYESLIQELDDIAVLLKSIDEVNLEDFIR